MRGWRSRTGRQVWVALVLCALTGCVGGTLVADEAGETDGESATIGGPEGGAGGAAVPENPAPPTAPPVDAPPTEAPPEEPDVPEVPDTPEESGVPCAIQQIVEPRCGMCHGASPRFGAPNSLSKIEDFHAASPLGGQVFERLLPRIEHATSPMPPPPNNRVPTAEIATLRTWVAAGAPAGPGCDVDEPVPPDDVAPPADDLDCEYELELKAHGGFFAGDEAPFRVPQATDHYECFYFRPPWNVDVHGLAFTPIVDDDRVLHHYLLYMQSGAGFGDGDHDACLGRHENAELVAGWAPGGQPYILPPDVGLHLGSGQNNLFVLEIHYNNSANYADAADRSGVRVCATSNRRPQTAGMQWLGTENLLMLRADDHERAGTCNPRLNQPAHILTSTPHMHRRGVHMRTVINRAAGGSEVLLDEPFDFENQIMHETPATVYPGDTLTTTCTFRHEGGLVGFGNRTQDEMCYNFVVVYPYGAFNTGGSLTNAENACLR